jgi:hypothetical protein
MMDQRTLVNVGEDTTLCDCDVPEKLVQLLIVADGELKVTGDDTGLLVIASSVASQLKNFGSEVLEDGSEVDGSAGTDTLSVVALAEETMDTTNGECETSLGRTAIRGGLAMNASWSECWTSQMVGRQSKSGFGKRCAQQGKTHDCAFLEPLALPPDFPPPVILIDLLGVGEVWV